MFETLKTALNFSSSFTLKSYYCTTRETFAFLKKKDSISLVKPSHIRENLLLTFTHAERRPSVSMDMIQQRLLSIFEKTTIIIIAREKHKNGGFHFHAGLLTIASRHTAFKILREAFPEWDGEKFIHLTFKRGWPVICSYLTKEDPNYKVWGTNRESIITQAHIHRNHRKRLMNVYIQNSSVNIKNYYGAKSPPSSRLYNKNMKIKEKLLDFGRIAFYFTSTFLTLDKLVPYLFENKHLCSLYGHFVSLLSGEQEAKPTPTHEEKNKSEILFGVSIAALYLISFLKAAASFF